MADDRERVQALVLVLVPVVVAVLAVAVGGAVRVAMLVGDGGPRRFDETELVPLIAGLEVVEAPAESCGPDRSDGRDCSADATVRRRGSSRAEDVVAANAEAAGFEVDASEGSRDEARRGDRCLTVRAGRDGAAIVSLVWC